jgi:hypothetical protein
MIMMMQQSDDGIQERRTRKVDYRQDSMSGICQGYAGEEMRTILDVFDVDVNKKEFLFRLKCFVSCPCQLQNPFESSHGYE